MQTKTRETQMTSNQTLQYIKMKWVMLCHERRSELSGYNFWKRKSMNGDLVWAEPEQCIHGQRQG